MKILTTVLTAAALTVSTGADANTPDTVEMRVQLHLDQTLVDGSSLRIDDLLESKTTLHASDYALDRVTITARSDDQAAVALAIDEYETTFVSIPETADAIWHETTLRAPVEGASGSWYLQTQGDITVASLDLALIPITTDAVHAADATVNNTYITRIRRGPLDRRRWRPTPARPVIIDRGPSVSLTYVSSRYRPGRFRSPLARTIAYRNDSYWHSNRYTSRPITRQPIIITNNAYDRRGVRQRDRSTPRTTATPRPRADKPRARVPRNRAEREQPRRSERRTRRGIPVNAPREDV